MIERHEATELSTDALEALGDEIAELVEAPPRAFLDTGVLVVGGKKCLLREARPVIGDTADDLIGVLARGGTLTICSAQDLGPLLGLLATSLGTHLEGPPNLNVYLTGPDTPGAGAHIDSHDVAAVHVSGTKEWRMGDACERSVTLSPGALLLVPSGVRHTTISRGTRVSVHIAVNCATLIRTRDDFLKLFRAGLGEFESTFE